MLEGLPPNNAAHMMRLTCDEATARAVADIIVETFDPAETAAAAFETEANVASWQSREWTVEVFFGMAPDEAQVRALVAATVGEEAAQALVFGRVAERDWVQASLDGLAPVRAGRFVVHGAHARGGVGGHEIALEIEAALAFGTGHHGTTRGCLLLLDAVLKQRRPRKILDVGTGTGVLAMAAAKALKQRVAAGDIDAIAVAAAAANARRNGAGPWVKPVVARGLSHPALRAGAPYDLILANILAKPLRLLAPGIAAAAAPAAELILSGLLVSDVAGVLAAYRAQQFFLARRLVLDGWASLLLRRGARSAA
jgi:ribosomal protein L11 methyltransferase